jgi:hypothetical protein
MTTIVHLTRAEFRKLVAARTVLTALALSVGLAVISVAVNAAVAGQNHTPALGTTASTDQTLKIGSVCCVAMLVLGIIASGSEYRHKTIIPAVLVAPRRGALIIAKVIGITVAGVVLSGLTFGLGLVTAVAELSAHHIHHLPTDTGSLFAGSVIAGALFGVVGVTLGYITPQHHRRRRRRRRLGALRRTGHPAHPRPAPRQMAGHRCRQRSHHPHGGRQRRPHPGGRSRGPQWLRGAAARGRLAARAAARRGLTRPPR